MVPDPILVALIAGVSGVVGGLIAAVIKPVGDNLVNKGADKRAERARRRAARIARIDRVVELLSMSGVEGPSTFSSEKGMREIPAAVAAVDDAELSEAIGRFIVEPRHSEARESARNNALRRAGTLLNQADREP